MIDKSSMRIAEYFRQAGIGVRGPGTAGRHMPLTDRSAQGFGAVLETVTGRGQGAVDAGSRGATIADYLARRTPAAAAVYRRSTLHSSALDGLIIDQRRQAFHGAAASTAATTETSAPIAETVDPAPVAEVSDEALITRGIHAAAGRYGLSPQLIEGVIRAESGFRPDAVSPAGAQGLMQLMPATARELGVNDPFDIAQNIDGGARYLRQMLDRFEGDLPTALAAYNAGPGTVARYNGDVPYPETRRYVQRILAGLDGTHAPAV